MLTVDRTVYPRRHFQTRFAELASIDPFRSPPGNRYALCLKHPFDTVAAALYVRERAGSILLLHPDTPPDRAAAQAGQAGCSALVYGEWNRIVPLAVQPADNDAEPALYQYSSGTTGRPKLIGRSWDEVKTETAHYNRSLKADSGDRPVILVPVSHSFGLIAGVFSAFEREAEPIVVLDKNPRFAASLVKTTQNAVVYAVPFLLNLLLSLSAELCLHKAVTSGSPLTPSLLARLMNRTGELWQQYGCSEAGCISLGANPSSPADVGRPLGHLTVETATDGDGPGEVIVALGGRTIRTGDLGLFDSGGRLHLAGRIDDTINVSGLKVLPSEVEGVIGEHPGVAEVVVHRTAHRVWGEAVKARIVPASAAAPTSAELKEWCLKHLPPYKVPSEFQFADSIPKTAAGKVSRKLLQEEELREG